MKSPLALLARPAPAARVLTPAFPTPRPRRPAAGAPPDQMVAALVQALIADRSVTAPAAVFGMYAVPCLYHPRRSYTVELGPDGGRCTCGGLDAPGVRTPEQICGACWHLQLVLWFLAQAPVRAQWCQVAPDLDLAWQDFLARRSRELAGLRAGDLAYQVVERAR